MAPTPLTPRPNSRTFVVGRTGSGKTTAALFLLSRSKLDRPWLIIDFKREPLFNSLLRSGAARHVDFRWHPEKTKWDIAIIRPRPGPDDAAVEELLWKLWRHGNCGLYADEAYLLPHGHAFRSILTQGRSKNIQVIALVQRPVYIDKFTLSEADNFAIFTLTDRDDRLRVTEFVPLPRDYQNPAPRHFWWYQLENDFLAPCLPVPPGPDIAAEISASRPLALWY